MIAHAIGSAIYKRGLQGSDGSSDYEINLPSWAYLVFLIDLILIIPASIIVNYTFERIFPTLAIVEDENPPAYEPVSLNDDAASVPEMPISGRKPPSVGQDGHGAVTSSFRATSRLLRAHGGFRAFFRGFFCLVAQEFLATLLLSIFGASLGGAFTPIATLLASLTLVQFSTAWVHIVISQPSELHFWRRLPPFQRTFNAVWRPVCLFWAASEVERWLPIFMAYVLSLEWPSLTTGFDPQDPSLHDNKAWWKVVIICIVTFVGYVFVSIPARVVLTRVQASLLPEGEDAILPFDRSFNGMVEPAVVGGRGYATIMDAWSTFSKAAWRRLIILYVKIFVVGLAVFAALFAVFVPEAIIIGKFTTVEPIQG